jgi:hypothetical protein
MSDYDDDSCDDGWSGYDSFDIESADSVGDSDDDRETETDSDGDIVEDDRQVDFDDRLVDIDEGVVGRLADSDCDSSDSGDDSDGSHESDSDGYDSDDCDKYEIKRKTSGFKIIDVGLVSCKNDEENIEVEKILEPKKMKRKIREKVVKVVIK